SGNSVNCAGSITNKARTRREFWFHRSDTLDELGNQYDDGFIKLGAQGGTQSLEPDLSMNFFVTVKNVNAEAKIINMIVSYGFTGQYVPVKVALRNIPIQQR